MSKDDVKKQIQDAILNAATEAAAGGVSESMDDVATAWRVILKIIAGMKGKFPLEETEQVLREVIGPELKPFAKIFGELVTSAAMYGAKARGERWKALVGEGIPEDVALCLVLDTDYSARAALNSYLNNRSNTKTVSKE